MFLVLLLTFSSSLDALFLHNTLSRIAIPQMSWACFAGMPREEAPRSRKLSMCEAYNLCVERKMRGSKSLAQYTLDSEFYNATGAGLLNTRSKSIDEITHLLRKGADVNFSDMHDKTALHWAASKGDLDCLKVLLEAKADVNISSQTTNTALADAAALGFHECVKALIEAKADVKKNNPLYWASQNGRLDCVKLLLKANADVYDGYGDTSLETAILNGHVDCVNELMKYSYGLVSSIEAVSESRKRIFNVFLQFVRLRNTYPELDNLKSELLQFEILSRNKLLQEDLVIIFLDELKKGREIKGAILIRSKEAVVHYLIKKLEEIISKIDPENSSVGYNPDGEGMKNLKALLKEAKIEETFGNLVRAGLDKKCEKLKVKSTR